MLRYNIKTGVKKIKTKTALAISGATLGFAGLIMAIAMPLGAKAVGCSVPSITYPTIQSAVNDPTCTTVSVAAGTYAEHVAVNRSVVLNGANAGTAGNGVRGAESIVNGTDTDAPFAITANNVTIDGFTVENGSNGGYFSGIWSQTGTQNSKIQNNIITQNGIGVWAQCGGNCLIEKNLFDGNNKTGPSGGAAISADSTTSLTINNNEFKNHTENNPILFQATGANVHQNDVISNNNIHNNSCGCSAIYALGLNNASFTSNDISADGSNIRFGGADSNVAVTMNILHGGTVGVNVVDDSFGFGLNTNITVHQNSLTGHSLFGVDNTTGQTLPVDATCNWWGAANGPGPVGPGSGDKVSTNVNFSPWLVTSDLNGNCVGGTKVTNKDDCKNGGWQGLTDGTKAFKNQGDCVSFVATKGKNKANG